MVDMGSRNMETFLFRKYYFGLTCSPFNVLLLTRFFSLQVEDEVSDCIQVHYDAFSYFASIKRFGIFNCSLLPLWPGMTWHSIA